MFRTRCQRLVAALFVSVGTAAAAADAVPPHHRSGGFQNNYIEFAPKSLPDLLRWRWQAYTEGLPPKPTQRRPRWSRPTSPSSARTRSPGLRCNRR